MIARPHICLRCQLRLAKRSTITKSQIAFQSTDTRLVSRLSEREHRPERPSGNSPNDGISPISDWPFVHFKRGQVSKHPLGRVYGDIGQLQREERERLDIAALGNRAEVIVLRESKIYGAKPRLREIEAVKPTSIDIQATLNSERGLVGQKEVEENINQLRPKKEQNPQSWDEINELVQEVQGGFTASQLARYIKLFGDPYKPPQTPEKAREVKKFIRISPWIPLSGDEKDGVQRYKRSSGGHPVASYTGKQLLALRLIQECWHLKLPELPELEDDIENEIGEIEIKLFPGVYKLLVNGYKPILNRIRSELLTNDGEGYEGYEADSILRIITTETKSKLVIQELEQELENLRKIRYPVMRLAPLDSAQKPYTQARRKEVTSWIMNNLSDEKLEHLSDITKTSVQRLPDHKVLVSYMDAEKDSLTSTRGDVALRLMIMSTDLPKSRTTHWLGCKDMNKKHTGSFIPYPTTRGFPWYARNRQWARWTTATKKWIDGTPAIKTVNSPELANSADEPPKIVKAIEGKEDSETQISAISTAIKLQQPNNLTDTDNGPLHWTTDYFTESSALIGSILHSLPQNPQYAMESLLPANLSTKAEQSFSASVPHLSVLLGSQYAKMVRRTPTKSVIMRLVPNPYYRSKGSVGMGSKMFTAFPNIEMNFKIMPETNDLVLDNMQAVLSTDISDLMLPDSSVDIRFEQNVRSRLRGKEGQDSLPPTILEFLENSDLNLEGTLVTPPKVSIPIASHLCRDPGFTLLDPSKDGREMHDVEYLFAGLEICKTVVMEFDGWILTYTSIESGSANGRRGELRLRPTRRTASNKICTEADFTNSAFQLVEALDNGNTRQVVKSMVETPLVRWTGPNGTQDKTRKKFHYFSKKIDLRDVQQKREDSRINAFWGALEEGESVPWDGQESFGEEVSQDKYDKPSASARGQ